MEHYLFTYGSLREKDIQETIYGHTLNGIPDTLVGYKISEISIEEEFGIVQYPIISPSENRENPINGIVYQISELDLQKTDIYEGRSYKRIQVKLESGQVAWAYIITT